MTSLFSNSYFQGQIIPAQEILAQAQQGHPIAIATLINYITQSRGVRVKVQSKGAHLHILLEYQQAPDRQQAVAFVQGCLTALEVQNVATVTVYGRQQGKKTPTWQQAVPLREERSIVPVAEEGAIVLVEDQQNQATDLLNLAAEHRYNTASSSTSSIQGGEGMPVNWLDPISLMENPLSLMQPSESPEILKRPESVAVLLFVSVFIFWDAYLSLMEEDETKPQKVLSTSQLARRLKTAKGTIRRKKRLDDFGAWTQSLDPEGIAWTYNRGVYLPESLI